METQTWATTELVLGRMHEQRSPRRRHVEPSQSGLATRLKVSSRGTLSVLGWTCTATTFIAILLALAIARCGVASADWSLPPTDPDLNGYLGNEAWSLQSYTETMPVGPTQQTTQPATPWWKDPRLQQLSLRQLPNSRLLAALPEPPATSSRQSMYEAVCYLADIKLPSSGPEVVVHTIEHAAEEGNFGEGLVLNLAGWGVSRLCHDHLPQLGEALVSRARQLLGL